MTVILLRAPDPSECDVLSDLCLRSKAVWGYDEAFLSAVKPELTFTEASLRDHEVQVAEMEGRIVGVAEVRMEDDGCFLEKLFIEPNLIRSGAGRLLYDWALSTARRLGADEMLIDADPDALGFYKRVGAEQRGVAPSGSIPGRMLPRLVHPLKDKVKTRG